MTFSTCSTNTANASMESICQENSQDRNYLIEADQEKSVTNACWYEDLPSAYGDALLFLDQQDQESGVHQAIVITDRQGVISHVNKAWKSLCEYDEREAIGRTFRFMQGAATDAVSLEYLHEHISKGLPVEVVLKNYTKSGRIFKNFLRVKPLLDEIDGEITHYLGVLADLEAIRGSQ
jgi:PAS domain S-box-containing protein